MESPANAANQDCWVWTVDPLEAPDQPEEVTITVEKGKVVAVNGERLSPFQALEKLNVLGGQTWRWPDRYCRKPFSRHEIAWLL